MGFSRAQREALRSAFLESPRDGHSLDHCISDDDLRRRVLEACAAAAPGFSELDYLWDLQNQRKASILGKHTTRTVRWSHDEYRHAAEIAARLVEDRHAATIDRLLCDPLVRGEFDRIVAEMAPAIDRTRLRLAALALRKASDLPPEAAIRMGHGREVTSVPAAKAARDPSLIPDLPGIYLFHDSTDIMYVGEAGNLRLRISTHLHHSSSAGLARYFWSAGGPEGCSIDLHTFPGSASVLSRSWRRAYGRALIASRRPRFNIEHNPAGAGA